MVVAGPVQVAITVGVVDCVSVARVIVVHGSSSDSCCNGSGGVCVGGGSRR